MVTKKTDKQKQAPKKKAAPKKVVKAAAAPKGEQKPRHPRARVTSLHSSKDALAKSLAESLAKPDEDTGVIADRLRTASNSQLLRLQHVVETVKSKYGDRSKLIAKLGTAENKAKDKDYLAKLDGYSLPQLLDLAQSHDKRARA
jgi:hypothetical protein